MIRLLFLMSLFIPASAGAETARIAVATNFVAIAERLAEDYATTSGDEILVTAGATGKLYAQITAGAPFDAFLSADAATPARLADEGFAVSGTVVAYAEGRLALWSADPARDLSDPAAALRAARHVAVANPDLAPYGKAAIETLDHMGLRDEIAPKIVTGENIGQAHAMVASGAAELGFVAASALAETQEGVVWPVPADHHVPLTHDAVLLTHGADNAAAKGFLAFLGSAGAREIIDAAGYGLP